VHIFSPSSSPLFPRPVARHLAPLFRRLCAAVSPCLLGRFAAPAAGHAFALQATCVSAYTEGRATRFLLATATAATRLEPAMELDDRSIRPSPGDVVHGATGTLLREAGAMFPKRASVDADDSSSANKSSPPAGGWDARDREGAGQALRAAAVAILALCAWRRAACSTGSRSMSAVMDDRGEPASAATVTTPILKHVAASIRLPPAPKTCLALCAPTFHQMCLCLS
jgi:hypothetical protein